MSTTDDLRHLIDTHGGLIDNLADVFPAPFIAVNVWKEADIASVAAHAGVEVKHDIGERTHTRSVTVRHGNAALKFRHVSMNEPVMLRGAMRTVEEAS